jgi:hypothetical protein
MGGVSGTGGEAAQGHQCQRKPPDLERAEQTCHENLGGFLLGGQAF